MSAKKPKSERLANPILREILAELWKPTDKREPYAWLESHISSIPYSPQPGPFRLENSPWMREIMNAIVNPQKKLIFISAAIQSGKSVVSELMMCYIVANLPGPTLWLDKNDDDAKDVAENRLQKLFKNCDEVKKYFPSDANEFKKATMQFNNGMTLWVRGAHNKSNLQNRSIRWIVGDETWLWPNGHIAEARGRTTAFGWLGKCIFMSQGSEDGDETDATYRETDMCDWNYRCPHCGEYSPYRWENIEWDKNAKNDFGDYDLSKVATTTKLICPKCKTKFEDSERQRRLLNKRGKFVSTNPNPHAGYAGFHWNALATMSWGELAEMYLTAKSAARKGDISLLKIFYQKRLALPWKEFAEDFTLDLSTSTYKFGDEWAKLGAITKDGKIETAAFDKEKHASILATLTVDVQMSSFYAVVRGWSVDGSSRLLYQAQLLTWEDISEIQERFHIYSSLVFLDAGFTSSEVYKRCAKNKWTALMGDSRECFLHKQRDGKPVYRFYSPARKISPNNTLLTCKMFFWSNLNVKDILAKLRANQDANRGVTWEVPQDVSDDYIKQINAERRLQVGKKWEWVNVGRKDNHYFDCESMAIVGALMLKIIGADALNIAEDAQKSI